MKAFFDTYTGEIMMVLVLAVITVAIVVTGTGWPLLALALVRYSA
jgi:hypothetical protein